jgi:hypothetical protein
MNKNFFLTTTAIFFAVMSTASHDARAMNSIAEFGDFREEWSRLGPSLPPDDPNDKSTFRPTGVVIGTALGFASGINDLVFYGIGMAGAVVPISADFIISNATGDQQTSLQDKYFAAIEKPYKAIESNLTPRPEEFTTVGRILYSLTRAISPLAPAVVSPLAGVASFISTTTMKIITDSPHADSTISSSPRRAQ